MVVPILTARSAASERDPMTRPLVPVFRISVAVVAVVVFACSSGMTKNPARISRSSSSSPSRSSALVPHEKIRYRQPTPH